MFTGIVQGLGKMIELQVAGGDARMHFRSAGVDLRALRPGDSVAVSGVCLTATSVDGVDGGDGGGTGFWADVSAETLSRTTMGDLIPGAAVNFECALTPATPLGGHLDTGHVDGTGTVSSRHTDARSVRLRVEAPARLARYIAEKGSICVDGVSLTVNAVDGAAFDVNVVPHTLERTTMGEFAPGRRVNLEVDIIARYLERLLQGEGAATPNA